MPAPFGRQCERILVTLARYYVLVRPQIQAIVFPGHKSGRATRTYLTRLFKAGQIGKTRHVPYGQKYSPCPVYYLTDKGRQTLMDLEENSLYEYASTQVPRSDRVEHWIKISEIHLRVAQAIGVQKHAKLMTWINEWNRYREDGHHGGQFYLHAQLAKDPPLSCSPDAAFVLEVGEASRPYYVEADRATSSAEHVIAQKHQGYNGLWRSGFFKERHFPQVTDNDFRILLVTTHRTRRDQLARAMKGKSGEHRWLFTTIGDFRQEHLLYEPVVVDCEKTPRRLLVPPGGYVSLDPDVTAKRRKRRNALENLSKTGHDSNKANTEAKNGAKTNAKIVSGNGAVSPMPAKRAEADHVK